MQPNIILTAKQPDSRYYRIYPDYAFSIFNISLVSVHNFSVDNEITRLRIGSKTFHLTGLQQCEAWLRLSRDIRTTYGLTPETSDDGEYIISYWKIFENMVAAFLAPLNPEVLISFSINMILFLHFAVNSSVTIESLLFLLTENQIVYVDPACNFLEYNKTTTIYLSQPLVVHSYPAKIVYIQNDLTRDLSNMELKLFGSIINIPLFGAQPEGIPQYAYLDIIDDNLVWFLSYGNVQYSDIDILGDINVENCFKEVRLVVPGAYSPDSLRLATSPFGISYFIDDYHHMFYPEWVVTYSAISSEDPETDAENYDFIFKEVSILAMKRVCFQVYLSIHRSPESDSSPNLLLLNGVGFVPASFPDALPPAGIWTRLYQDTLKGLVNYRAMADGLTFKYFLHVIEKDGYIRGGA